MLLRTKGQTLVEYGLLIALVVLVVIAVLALLGPSIASNFSEINSAID